MGKELTNTLLKLKEKLKTLKNGKDNQIHISKEFIQQLADENEVEFDEMVKIINEELK
jgi:hypothetical protein